MMIHSRRGTTVTVPAMSKRTSDVLIESAQNKRNRFRPGNSVPLRCVTGFTMRVPPNDQGKRPGPAATDARTVTDMNGWSRSAPPSGWLVCLRCACSLPRPFVQHVVWCVESPVSTCGTNSEEVCAGLIAENCAPLIAERPRRIPVRSSPAGHSGILQERFQSFARRWKASAVDLKCIH
jgi:hypothetical protein